MAVYCDECTKPGSPNDEAGYTQGGGWLCEKHRPAKKAGRKCKGLHEGLWPPKRPGSSPARPSRGELCG